ncbi:MAG: Helix-turn-helix domain protein [Euryarchaeota archaeon ADurb.BinA087]|nr:MAG: Helix-turn-helix domain protein [Euryarchaeota archaeon ADurb.BinA087]
MTPTPVFYTTEEVANLLKISAKTVREMIKSKRLEAVRVGKEYRITEDQIRKYIKENKT